MEEKLEVGILFRSNDELIDGFALQIPERVVLGFSRKENNVFIDYLSDHVFLSTGIISETEFIKGVNCIISLDELKEKYKTEDFKEISLKYLKDIKKYVYYYDNVSVYFHKDTIERFYKKYNIEINYDNMVDCAHQVNAFLNGDINALYNMYGDDFEYDGEEVETSDKSSENEVSEQSGGVKLSDIYNKIKESVKGQDDQIKTILTAIYKNYIFKGAGMKSNILIYGPTGVGKTEIVRNISKIFNVPVLIEDVSRHTSAGYKGEDIDDMFLKLYNMAGGNLELAQNSILMLDEIDKKATGDGSSIAKQDVLRQLLKVIEGGSVRVEINPYQSITFDTTNLTIIAAGAFSGIYKSPAKKVGFTEKNEDKKVKDITIDDFVAFGMPQEFMGRFDTVVPMNEMTKDIMIDILKNSDISPLTKYIEAFKLLGINTNFSEELYEVIANKAFALKTGARGLKLVVDEIFSKSLYDIFNESQEMMDINIEDSANNKTLKISLTR